MGFGDAVKAYLQAQLHCIDEELARSGRHPHRAVHEVRKAVRRFRSVLALSGDAVPQAVERVDRRVRRIGKTLSGLRDAHVLVGTAATLRRRDGQEAIWHALDRLLRRRRAHLLTQARQDDPEFKAMRWRVVRSARRLADTDFSALTRRAVLQALDDSARRATKMERKANDSTRASVRHRWRRQVRRLRLQLEGLEAIAHDVQAPAAARVQAQWILGAAMERMPSAATLAVLADRLGRDQDRDSLESFVEHHEDLPYRGTMLRVLERRDNRRRASARSGQGEGASDRA